MNFYNQLQPDINPLSSGVECPAKKYEQRELAKESRNQVGSYQPNLLDMKFKFMQMLRNPPKLS